MKDIDNSEFPTHKTLTPAQMKTACLLASGVPHRSISRELGISTRSIFLWLKENDFISQIKSFSDSIMAEYQADVLNRLKETPRYLSEIIENPKEKATDRIAAIASLRDTAINWHVVRPLEEARQKMQGGEDA